MAFESAWEAALSSREDLAEYGANDILLFALELYFDIEDIRLVATDALTDGSGDKKCDLVYVDRELGKAVVAQAYKATNIYNANNEIKECAPANKASDLNTACTWLLGTSIDQSNMNEILRSASAELTQAILENEIKTIQIWYVHNLPESDSVQQELDRAKSTADSLIYRHYYSSAVDEISCLEIGRNFLEKLYQSTKAPILVTDQYELQTRGGYETVGEKWKSYSTSIPASWLRSLFRDHGRDLFSANVRDYLGSNRRKNNINNNIKKTAQQEPGLFWAYNNGITAIVNNYTATSEEDLCILEIEGIAIVNGAQTTGSLSLVPDGEHINDIYVPARFVQCDDHKIVENIIKFNNSQNEIEVADFRSNDPTQVRLREEFTRIDEIDYKGGRRGGIEDKSRKSPNLIPSYSAGQSLAAFHRKPSQAYNKKRKIWESDSIYSHYFNERLHAGHIIFTYSLLRACENLKEELKSTLDQDRTSQDNLKISFLSKRGALYAFVAGISNSLEAILDKPIQDSFDLSFRDISTIENAIEKWMPVVSICGNFCMHLDGCFNQNNLKSDNNEQQESFQQFSSFIASIRASTPQVFDDFKEKVNI